MKQIELTSKLVVALIAVVVASAMISAPVIAQQSAPPIRDNSVTSASIKDGEVKTADLADGAVTSAKIADDAITLNVHEVEGEVLTLDPGRTGTAFADCPDGEILTGGGFETDYPVHVATSQGRGNGDNAWAVEGANDAGSIPLHMQAFAYCLDPTIP